MTSPSGARGPEGRQCNSGNLSLAASTRQLSSSNHFGTPSEATGPEGRQCNSENEDSSSDIDVDELVQDIQAEAQKDLDRLRAENQQAIERLKHEHSLELKTVRAENDSLRRDQKELEEKNRGHQEQQRKWRKLFEDFLKWAPNVDRDGASHKARKAFGAFAKLVDVARTSLQEI